MKTYSEPKKNSKGLWEVTVTREDGWVELIVEKTTKKAITQWLKEQRKEGETN